MRRWNGWGDDATAVHLPDATRALLAARLGAAAAQPPDLGLDEVCRRVPPSRLPAHPAIDTTPEARVRHAGGQGFPDLVALRTGERLGFPDGVARPHSEEEVRDLLAFAGAHGVAVVPYGGGTSVVGHLAAARGGAPVLVVALEQLAALRELDPVSRLATIGAGAAGPALERALRGHGFTLGHFPQSFEYSTLGGWIATRSSGQQSLGYGRIEQLFAGGTVVAPEGTLRLPPFPASAAGPDLRQLVLGSEGRLGVITEAVVRVTPVPDEERFHVAFLPHWGAALDAARALAQERVPLSMVRASTPLETATNLSLAGRERLVRLLGALLRARGIGDGRSMLIVGASGTRRRVRAAIAEALRTVRAHGGVSGGHALGKGWRRGRFRAPYLRDVLWETGYCVDTVETATTWAAVPRTLNAIEAALGGALRGEGERVFCFTHLSHLYATGASIYTTFVFRRAPAADETLERWRTCKRAASEAIVAAGATISHHHGVGAEHAPYLAAEKGAAGVRMLAAALRALDRDGVMNPGALLPADQGRGSPAFGARRAVREEAP